MVAYIILKINNCISMIFNAPILQYTQGTTARFFQDYVTVKSVLCPTPVI